MAGQQAHRARWQGEKDVHSLNDLTETSITFWVEEKMKHKDRKKTQLIQC